MALSLFLGCESEQLTYLKWYPLKNGLKPMLIKLFYLIKVPVKSL